MLISSTVCKSIKGRLMQNINWNCLKKRGRVIMTGVFEHIDPNAHLIGQ